MVPAGQWVPPLAIPGDPTLRQNLICLICWPVFGQHKKCKKNKLVEIHPNLKKSYLRCPRLQFWCLFAAIWTSVFYQFSWPSKSVKLQHLQCENLLFIISGLPFGQQKSIKQSYLFKPSSWTSFSHSNLIFFFFMLDWGSLRNLVGAETVAKIDQVVQNWWKL